ncbi:MAG: OmpA family protein [Planctomycetes bacterium]|nr:OmpA family protein [Planctomycetota bacterium]
MSEESNVDTNFWLNTFGDLITLLMTFFVLMLSFTALNAAKFRAALDSIENTFGSSVKEKILENDGVLEMVNPQAVTTVMDGEETPPLLNPMDKVYEEVVEYLTQSKFAQFLEMKKTKQGFVIKIDSGAFFDEGKSQLKEEHLSILDKIVELLKLFPNNLSIEGHIGKTFTSTDAFPSSMDLSIARAVSTCQYFLNKGITPERLGVAGYGSYRPLDVQESGNVSDDRIEITILNLEKNN